jgi:hypothetical protein
MCDERQLTIEQLAQRLQYSVDWIRGQVRAGPLPAIRFNRLAWRFHWPSVLAALQRLEVARLLLPFDLSQLSAS